MSDTKRARYALEFKTEALRRVRGGQAALGYVSSMQFEKSWHAAQLLKAG